MLIDILKKKMMASPIFKSFNTDTIASDGIWVLAFGDMINKRKWSPFDTAIVTNWSSYNIEVWLNGSAKYILQSGMSQQYNGAINSIKFVNAGTGNITANQIEVAYQNTKGQNTSRRF